MLSRKHFLPLALVLVSAIVVCAPQQSSAQHVARDPSILPPPIRRSEPTVVRATMTIEERSAELANQTTYNFWTFNGTVPGQMLRVMEGDTVELTLINPATNLRRVWPKSVDARGARHVWWDRRRARGRLAPGRS